MSQDLDKAFETIDSIIQDAAQNLFLDQVLQFLWIILIVWLVYLWWVGPEDTPNVLDPGLFEPGNCTEDFSLIVWHPSRKDLVEIQVAKWKHAVKNVTAHNGSLKEAYMSWSQRATKSNVVFVKANSFCNAKTLDLLAYRSRTEQCMTFVDENWSFELPFAMNASFGHRLQSDYISKKLNNNACAGGHSDTSVLPNIFQRVFGVPFRVLPNANQTQIITLDETFSLDAHLRCIQVLQEQDI